MRKINFKWSTFCRESRVYSVASVIIVMLVLLMGYMVTGCQKNSHLPDESLQSSVINEERMSIIADLSKDYENAIKEALSERIQLRSMGTLPNTFDITERINAIYQEKCIQYGSLPKVSLRSGSDEFIDADIIQIYLDKLLENWDIAINVV
jgi:hypothetical protein